MAIYLYSNPKNENELIEVVQGMNDVHEFYQEGIKWNRVFTVPQASIDTKIDPFNKNKFVEKTGNSKGSLGSLLDQSKELSLKREKILGKDPIKEKSDRDWQLKRKRKDGSVPKVIGSADSRKFDISAS